MSIRRYIGLWLVLICLHVGGTGALGAPPPDASGEGAGDERVTLDFKNIALPDLVQTISELTGKNFLYDEALKGEVTILSPRSMSRDEAYKLFLTVLNVKGFTVVPSGKVHKIVPVRTAKESNLPTVIDSRGEATEQIVTQLIRLENLDASVMANQVLASLVPKTGSIVAYPPSNTLIITDSAANIERLAEIIRELDKPGSLDLIEVIPLEHAAAEEVAQICTQVLAEGAGTTSRRRRRSSRNVQTAGNATPSKVIPYPRNNVLVVMASEEDLETIEDLVAELDREPDQERSNINVYYLENADAETLAKTLNEIITGIKAESQAKNAQRQGGGSVTLNEPVTITADKPTNSLIINAVPEDYTVIKGIIDQLDIKRKQVFVEALILELTMDATRELGSSLQGAVETGGDSVVFGTSNLNTGQANLGELAPTGDSGTPSLLTRSLQGILLGGLFNPITTTAPDGSTITVPAFSALIDLSRSNSDINILSAPRLLTSDNEEAEIIVGQNVPIITSRLTDTGGSAESLAQSVSVERKDVALTLRFTPQITEGELVRLNVYQEITDIAQTSVGDINQVGPTLTKRLLRNSVLCENGQTVVLGGLISSNVQTTTSKVPLLGDIPLLGWLFRHESTSDRKTNLLVFITPKILKNGDDLDAVTRESREQMRRFRIEEMKEKQPQNFFETPTSELPAEGDSGQAAQSGSS